MDCPNFFLISLKMPILKHMWLHSINYGLHKLSRKRILDLKQFQAFDQNIHLHQKIHILNLKTKVIIMTLTEKYIRTLLLQSKIKKLRF